MKHLYLCICISLLFCFPSIAAELLTGDEQSFESGPTAGRWEEFTWPDTSSGGLRPSALDKASEGASGATVTVDLWADAPATWGSNCLAIYDDTFSASYPNCGGVMITLDVVLGATYTVSGHISFATDVDPYDAAGGISIDTDGGTDPLTVDYGFADGIDEAVDPEPDLRNEFDPLRAPDPTYGGDAWLTGEWAWNESFLNAPGLEGQWWGPPTNNFTVDVLSTGAKMTVFLWGFTKKDNTAILFDGISVDGPAPTPPAGAENWEKYR